MADCEMCGKKDVKLLQAKIEGSLMKVCSTCASYGEVQETSIRFRQTNFSRGAPRMRTDPDENNTIVSNLGQLVKSAREKRGLKQEQVAKAINEKESLLHQIESAKISPRFKTARKLEKYFGLKLVVAQEVGETSAPRSSGGGEPLTMGDLLKQAMKK